MVMAAASYRWTLDLSRGAHAGGVSSVTLQDLFAGLFPSQKAAGLAEPVERTLGRLRAPVEHLFMGPDLLERVGRTLPTVFNQIGA
jgi:hypothetical protein